MDQEKSEGRASFSPQKLLPSTTVILYEPCVQRMSLTWRVLCHQRADNRLWGFIGGAQELGENIIECAIREAYEETGFHVTIERLACIDSALDSNIMHYPDGQIIQYMNITFTARLLDNTLYDQYRLSQESIDMGWFYSHQLPQPFSDAHAWRLFQAIHINQAPPVR